MEYAYQKLMAKHQLTYAELPEDAKTGIDVIKDVQRAIKMAEAKGNAISEKTYNKLKINDKFVVGEILDYVNDNDNDDDDEVPFDAKEIKDEMVESKSVQLDPLGLSIDEELKNIVAQNKSKLSIEEVKKFAPNSYRVIFDSYDPDEENGIETSFFKLIEKEDSFFHIIKK
jgi:hypothetical protein